MSAPSQRSYRVLYPDVLEREVPQTVSLEAWLNGALAPPDSATYTLIRPDGTAQINAAPASIVGGIATYAIPALSLPSTLAFGEMYQSRWAMTYGTQVDRPRREAAVTAFKLYPPITDIDLTRGEYPDLINQLGDISTSLQEFIDQAYGQFVRKLWKINYWPDLIVSQHDIVDPVRQLALYLVMKALYRSQKSANWKELMDIHAEGWKGEWSGFKARLDKDHDGLADSEDKAAATTVVHRNMRPRRRARTNRW